jgi:hypothetical protein
MMAASIHDAYRAGQEQIHELTKEVEWWKRNSDEHSEGRVIWRDKAKRAEAQNADLLEALEEVSKWLSHVDIPYTVGYQVRKAIRKAKGE